MNFKDLQQDTLLGPLLVPPQASVCGESRGWCGGASSERAPAARVQSAASDRVITAVSAHSLTLANPVSTSTPQSSWQRTNETQELPRTRPPSAPVESTGGQGKGLGSPPVCLSGYSRQAVVLCLGEPLLGAAEVMTLLSGCNRNLSGPVHARPASPGQGPDRQRKIGRASCRERVSSPV